MDWTQSQFLKQDLKGLDLGFASRPNTIPTTYFQLKKEFLKPYISQENKCHAKIKQLSPRSDIGSTCPISTSIFITIRVPPIAEQTESSQTYIRILSVEFSFLELFCCLNSNLKLMVYIYTYIYIYISVCVCVCVNLSVSVHLNRCSVDFCHLIMDMRYESLCGWNDFHAHLVPR